jgi:ABC-type transport system involved in cytochrome c biogenesis permease subunit
MKRHVPWILTAVFVVWLLSALRIPAPKSAFNTNAFGKLPVLANGRLKPLDTVARTSLLMLRGKQSISDADDRALTPSEWMMDVLMRPSAADKLKVFVITSPDVLDQLHANLSQGKYYSFHELQPYLNEIERQSALAEKAGESPTGEKASGSAQSLFQREILKLRDRIVLYNRLKSSWLTGVEEHLRSEDFGARVEYLARAAYVRIVPRANDQDWQSAWQSLMETMRVGGRDESKPLSESLDPAVRAYATMANAYNSKDAPAFNDAVAKYRTALETNFGKFLKKTDYEFRFNAFEPFYQCMILYVCIFLLALFSWLVWPDVLGRSAFWLLVLTFVVHTFGLISRMWLQDRPPVTNLYSSAIFIGWAVCGLCIILERIFRNGIGSLTAATSGFITLLIAHHLSLEGDTMEMLRAVLDTNFWLATHVVAVTLGYAATFLAGLLAIIYILRGVFTTSLDKPTAKSLNNMVYGIVCFATLFSFVGTVLGGIWADQSWGRFWGFDPKENGALLIVLWNATILHARWGGFIRERGLMNMAVFGNIVTAFSWFGVNMLGAGLHSYGFMDQAYLWLIGFDISQIVLMIVGGIPLRHWRSFAKQAETAAAVADAAFRPAAVR